MSSSQTHHHLDERHADLVDAAQTPRPKRHSMPLATASPKATDRDPPREPDVVTSPSTASDSFVGFPSAAATEVSDLVFPIRSVVSVEKSASNIKSDVNDHASSNLFSPLTRSRGSTLDTRSGSLFSPSTVKPAAHSTRGRSRDSVDITPHARSDPSRYAPSTVPFELDMQSWKPDPEDDPACASPHLQDSADVSSHVSDDDQSVSDVPLITTRFTHVETPEGHAVITGIDSVPQQCEDEPIQAPGAIQSFGCFLGLVEESVGSFLVHYTSENSKRLLGYSPRSLFRLSNFLDILTDDQQDNFLDHVDFIKDEEAASSSNGPEIFSLTVRHPKLGRYVKLWCAIHINTTPPQLIICEFELDNDQTYPLRPPDEKARPGAPTDTLESNPSERDLEESTTVSSKPLRIIRSARKRRGEQGAMQVFDILSQVEEQFASASSLEMFLNILVGIVKELTGFHRIMTYQFDSSFNGKVVTELVDPIHTLDLYKGLHFPASDIPRQARELYKVNKVRLLYDRDQPTARIVCRSVEDLNVPLDMTHAYLRAMSPIHIKYLANMHVRSSMSISITVFKEIWGLIACHSYGEHGMRVSFPVRKLCRLVGETASRNVERLVYASRLQARKLINTSPTNKNPSSYIVASSDDLLTLFDADCGLLSIKDETKVLGVMEHSQEALALLEYLRMRKLTSVLASQDVKFDFPDLKYAPGFHYIAGFLYAPLSVAGNDFIVFFRRGQVDEVKWAGNPYEKKIREGTAACLEPRASFKVWNETVMGKCREWNEEHVETASVLCLVYGKFIEIWRQKEAALQSSKLTQLLLANSAHEVRTPLNAIINYLEIALEGTLDGETRENLLRSHSASKSLIYVINDLLDLTKTEKGQHLMVKDEVFGLKTCIQEATDPFKTETDRKGLSYDVVTHDGLPKFVHGDTRRLRQALSNVIANAIKHTDQGSIKINIQVREVEENLATIEFEVTDTGVGMSSQQLDALFRDLEQVSASHSDSEDSITSPDGTKSSQILGLGLAVVSRIVQNMNGQLRLTSEVGKGSRFIIQLPFQVPESEMLQVSNATDNARQLSEGHLKLANMDLINKKSSANIIAKGGINRTGSGSAGRSASQGSRGSNGSGRSDADRLLDAIQTPMAKSDDNIDYFSARTRKLKVAVSKSRSFSTGRAVSEVDRQPLLPSPSSRSKLDTGTMAESATPVKAVTLEEDKSSTARASSPVKSKEKLVEIKSQLEEPKKQSKASQETSLRVLIAEDDPINLKILRKRLERLGHSVTHAVNGEDCAALFRKTSEEVDLILMDMQMPIVDGLTSTKMIRCMEKDGEKTRQSALSRHNGRVPIFAVSASLLEEKRSTYVDAGFDAWILKPIDFKRLGILMSGISDDEARNTNLYVEGQWEAGGWFFRRRAEEQEGVDE